MGKKSGKKRTIFFGKFFQSSQFLQLRHFKQRSAAYALYTDLDYINGKRVPPTRTYKQKRGAADRSGIKCKQRRPTHPKLRIHQFFTSNSAFWTFRRCLSLSSYSNVSIYEKQLHRYFHYRKLCCYFREFYQSYQIITATFKTAGIRVQLL